MQFSSQTLIPRQGKTNRLISSKASYIHSHKRRLTIIETSLIKPFSIASFIYNKTNLSTFSSPQHQLMKSLSPSSVISKRSYKSWKEKQTSQKYSP